MIIVGASHCLLAESDCGAEETAFEVDWGAAEEAVRPVNTQSPKRKKKKTKKKKKQKKTEDIDKGYSS